MLRDHQLISHVVTSFMTQALKKASPNTPRDDGCTALYAACQAGHVDAVDMLLLHGADATLLFQGWTALQAAASGGHVDCIQLLLRSEKQRMLIDACEGEKDGRTALHIAVVAGHVHAAEALLLFGANPDKRDRSGQAALHLALVNKQLVVAQALIASGKANINICNAKQMTPLMLAAQLGEAWLVDLLLQSGANVNMIDDDGNSALDIARSRSDSLEKIEASKSSNGDEISSQRQLAGHCVTLLEECITSRAQSQREPEPLLREAEHNVGDIQASQSVADVHVASCAEAAVESPTELAENTLATKEASHQRGLRSYDHLWCDSLSIDPDANTQEPIEAAVFEPQDVADNAQHVSIVDGPSSRPHAVSETPEQTSRPLSEVEQQLRASQQALALSNKKVKKHTSQTIRLIDLRV